MCASKSILIFIYILITALSAGALPHEGTVTNILTLREPSDRKNERIGHIAGFSNPQCSGEPIPGSPDPEDGTTVFARPAFNSSQDQCITFNTPGEYVGIDWGYFFAMRSYNNPHCEPGSTKQLGMAFNPVISMTQVRSCFLQEMVMRGSIRSISFYGTRIPGNVDSNPEH